MRKVRPIPEFRLDNIPGKLLALGEAIVMVARVVNKLAKAHNELIEELELKAQKEQEVSDE